MQDGTREPVGPPIRIAVDDHIASPDTVLPGAPEVLAWGEARLIHRNNKGDVVVHFRPGVSEADRKAIRAYFQTLWFHGLLTLRLDTNLRLRRLLWPGVMTAAMLAVLLGLGTWQVERLHWKQDVLSQIARAEAAPAVPLPDAPEPYTKVKATGHLRDDLSASYGAEVRDTPAGTQLGTQLIVPLELDDGIAILVDRGWVPDRRPRPLAQAGRRRDD